MFARQFSHRAVCTVLAVVLALSAFSADSQPVGAITVGVFLSDMMDQVNQAITNAKNAGLTIEMQAGAEAAIAISNAQNAFADSTDRLFDRNLDPAISGSLDKIQNLVNDVSSNAFKTVDEATARAQQITNSLPLSNGEPQVTSVTPKFVVPAQNSYPVLIRIKGNFVNVAEPGYDPTLNIRGKQFSGSTTTQELQFTVPIGSLIVVNPAAPFSFGATQIDLDIPWSKPGFLHLLHSKVVDRFKLFVGALPLSPGKLSLTVVDQVPSKETKSFSGGNGRVCSQSECGNDDQKGVPVQIVADAGWSIVPGSCDLHANAHGDTSTSGPSYSGDRCIWSLTTIHHRFGQSGIIDYGPTAMESRTVSISTPVTTPIVLNWGDSKVFSVTSGQWKLSFDSFDGHHVEFNTSDNSNPFIAVAASINSASVKAADPGQLVWP